MPPIAVLRATTSVTALFRASDIRGNTDLAGPSSGPAFSYAEH